MSLSGELTTIFLLQEAGALNPQQARDAKAATIADFEAGGPGVAFGRKGVRKGAGSPRDRGLTQLLNQYKLIARGRQPVPPGWDLKIDEENARRWYGTIDCDTAGIANLHTAVHITQANAHLVTYDQAGGRQGVANAGAYAGAILDFEIDVPQGYPKEPPSLRIRNLPCRHPNFDQSGNMMTRDQKLGVWHDASPVKWPIQAPFPDGHFIAKSFIPTMHILLQHPFILACGEG